MTRQPLSSLSLGLAFFAFILIGAYAGATGVLLPSQIIDYHVDKSTIGLLFFTFSTGYFLSAISAGSLSQKLGQYGYLTSGTMTFLISCLVFSLKPPFLLLLVANSILGFGLASIDVGFNAVITMLPRSTQLLNYLHGFYGTGALLGPLAASTLLTIHWHWNSIYLIWGGLSLPVLIGCLILLRSRTGNVPMQQIEHQTTGNVLAAALKFGAVWLGALFLFLYAGAEIGVGTWSYSFLLEERHLGTLPAGWIVSGYWLGLTLGRFLVNILTRWLHAGIVARIYGCLAGVALGLVLVWSLPGAPAAALGFCLVGFSLGPIFPATVAVLPGALPGRLVDSAIGFLFASSVIGGALFSWLAGTLAQSFGTWTLLPVVLTLTALMCSNWWKLTRQIAKPHHE